MAISRARPEVVKPSAIRRHLLGSSSNTVPPLPALTCIPGVFQSFCRGRGGGAGGEKLSKFHLKRGPPLPALTCTPGVRYFRHLVRGKETERVAGGGGGGGGGRKK